MKLFLRIILVLLLILAVDLGYSTARVVRLSQADTPQTADAALVLGAAAWGNRPSPVFRERINHAISLYRQGIVRHLIFTGGTPKAGYPTEAAVARRYALVQGVRAQDIICETQSRDTLGNISGSLPLIRQNGWQRTIIVSDPYHMARADSIARHLGLDFQLSPTPTSRYRNAPLLQQWRFLAGEAVRLSLLRWQHLLQAALSAV